MQKAAEANRSWKGAAASGVLPPTDPKPLQGNGWMGPSTAALAGKSGSSFQSVCLCRLEQGRTGGQMERCPPGKHLRALLARGMAQRGGHAGCVPLAGLGKLSLCSFVLRFVSREGFFFFVSFFFCCLSPLGKCVTPAEAVLPRRLSVCASSVSRALPWEREGRACPRNSGSHGVSLSSCSEQAWGWLYTAAVGILHPAAMLLAFFWGGKKH